MKNKLIKIKKSNEMWCFIPSVYLYSKVRLAFLNLSIDINIPLKLRKVYSILPTFGVMSSLGYGSCLVLGWFKWYLFI